MSRFISKRRITGQAYPCSCYSKKLISRYSVIKVTYKAWHRMAQMRTEVMLSRFFDKRLSI